MTLRAIKPMPFPDLNPATEFGARPIPKWVAPTSLMVDGTYQRDLSERSIRLIRKTIEGFRWNRYKPPIVVKTGPATLHVIDGQHTAITAATLLIPEILILIVDADTLDERARAFVGHNTDRIVVSPFDIYRALLASGDPDARDVDNVCKRAGVRIRNISPSSAIAEGDTAAVGMIRNLVKRRGVIPARKVLQSLVKAKRAPITGAEILAAEHIVCNRGGGRPRSFSGGHSDRRRRRAEQGPRQGPRRQDADLSRAGRPLAATARSRGRAMTGLRDELIQKLEYENDILRARVRELEEKIGFCFECPPQFGLTRQEAMIFGLLLKNPMVTKEFAISALYLHKQDEAEIKIVDVFVCKARKKLKPWKIEIETVWGQGYRLTGESRVTAERLLIEANAQLARGAA